MAKIMTAVGSTWSSRITTS